MANKIKNIHAKGSDSLEKPGSSSEHVDKIKWLVSRGKSFLKDVRSEFDKITWSNKKETVSMAFAVLAISFFFAIYLGVIDIVLSKLVRFFIRA
ncbi:MAG: preprotein translocase subunit SecE [Dissulfurimicrobium sp.]|uniref:preprotein translocase subunit SecE n=1 Tax=Dissulfurimicrobium sp. TaxID=2022436 RepID=UPI00404A2761